MAVKLYKQRKAVVVSWDPGEYVGPILITTETEEDSSSTRMEQNEGYAAVTFPMKYTGKFRAIVFDNENNVIDQGNVTVA